MVTNPATSMVLLDGTIVEVNELTERVQDSEWDENWRVTDSNGHGHFYDPSGAPGRPFPTLTVVEEPCPMCDDTYECTDKHYVCSQCGERVDPARRTREHYVVLNRSFEITTHREHDGLQTTHKRVLTEAQYAKFWEGLQSRFRFAVDELLADHDPVAAEMVYQST